MLIKLKVRRIVNRQKIIFISGPSGSGKSTIVRKFSSQLISYIEHVERNPYISKLNTTKEFNAYGSQMWFIETMNNFIKSAPHNKDLIIDQSPEAIIYTYSKYFLEKGEITLHEFSMLEEKLVEIQDTISNRNYHSVKIFLREQPQTLYERVKERDKNNVMPIEWFIDISKYFENYYRNDKSVITIKSNDQNNCYIFEKIKKLIEN